MPACRCQNTSFRLESSQAKEERALAEQERVKRERAESAQSEVGQAQNRQEGLSSTTVAARPVGVGDENLPEIGRTPYTRSDADFASGWYPIARERLAVLAAPYMRERIWSTFPYKTIIHIVDVQWDDASAERPSARGNSQAEAGSY